MEHSIAEVNFVIIYVLVFSQMAGGNNMLQICGIQFKDSKTGEIFTLSLETGEVTVDSGREPTSDEFVSASFRGGIVFGGGIPRLLEMFPGSVITPENETGKE